MKKENIVKKNHEFSNIINSNNKFQNQYFIIYIKENRLSKTRFGISVGKKTGKAVIRNKIKRQIRNILDTQKKDYQNGFDCIIIIKKGVLVLQFKEIKQELIKVLIKSNVLRRR
ncbi:MAG: ribonuclease P protein component [Bacilli bacterium]